MTAAATVLTATLPAALTGAAVLLVLPAPRASRLSAAVPGLPTRDPRTRAGGRRVPALGPVAACALAGLALAALLTGPIGLMGGALVAVAGPRVLRGLEPGAERALRLALDAELPVALDLLAACLAGGAGLPAAVRAVAAAVPGPAGARFARVASSLEVGTAPADAWRLLAEDGRPRRAGAAGSGLAAAAARTLTRADDGGGPVSDAVVALANQAREAARLQGEQAAARAGVMAVGPLGLCFLPAFVLLGVVPVVIGLVGPVLRSL